MSGGEKKDKYFLQCKAERKWSKVRLKRSSIQKDINSSVARGEGSVFLFQLAMGIKSG